MGESIDEENYISRKFRYKIITNYKKVSKQLYFKTATLLSGRTAKKNGGWTVAVENSGIKIDIVLRPRIYPEKEKRIREIGPSGIGWSFI